MTPMLRGLGPGRNGPSVAGSALLGCMSGFLGGDDDPVSDRVRKKPLTAEDAEKGRRGRKGRAVKGEGHRWGKQIPPATAALGVRNDKECEREPSRRAYERLRRRGAMA